jgi:soluble lytic murein transglycosylase-like protein
MKKRAVFTLALEIAVLALTFCIIMVAMSADRTMSEFDKHEYPKKYSDAVEIAAAEFDLPENLIYAVIKAEAISRRRRSPLRGRWGLCR